MSSIAHFVPAPPLPRQIRKAAVPLSAIIVLGTIVGLILILLTAINPAGALIGFVLSTVAMVLVLAAYLWLDRWEPEPPRLLVLAFLWGASISILVSVVAEMVVDSAINSGAINSGHEGTNFLTAAVAAPIIEEATKGLFLLIMMTGRRRNEVNSLTDALVYAGVVAVGFAWVEDVFYIANGESLSESLLTAGMRLVMGPFAHPLFTTMTGIGVYFALQQRHALAKAGCLLAGFVAAVVMHGLWNGSALTGAAAYFGLYVLWMMPIFALTVTLAITSRRREQRIVAAALPTMVAGGLITANEATWLGSMRTRKLAVRTARGLGGRRCATGVRKFSIQVVELAFVRDRIERGFGDERVLALQNDEAHALMIARTAAEPALYWLAGYRIAT